MSLRCGRISCPGGFNKDRRCTLSLVRSSRCNIRTEPVKYVFIECKGDTPLVMAFKYNETKLLITSIDQLLESGIILKGVSIKSTRAFDDACNVSGCKYYRDCTGNHCAVMLNDGVRMCKDFKQETYISIMLPYEDIHSLVVLSTLIDHRNPHVEDYHGFEITVKHETI